MPGPRPDSGETFIEILVAIVLLGVGVVFTISGLVTSINTTTFNRTQAQINASLTSAAEWVKAQGWVPCTSTTSTNLTGLIGQATINASYSVTVAPPVPVGGGSCHADGSTSSQLESQQITVVGPHGANGTLTVVTRWS